jgi:hypothetical protein
MLNMTREQQQLQLQADLFCFVDRNASCIPIEQAFGELSSGKVTTNQLEDPSLAHHDIESLRLTRQQDRRWLLEVHARLRDPTNDWREYQRDQYENFVHRWLPVDGLQLDEEVGYFYHYVFANLDGFHNAGRFPGGYTRTVLQKLNATKVPQFLPVNLGPLVELEGELNEVKRKIELTDELLDQIVYRLYGLTDEEIAIVEK